MPGHAVILCLIPHDCCSLVGIHLCHVDQGNIRCPIFCIPLPLLAIALVSHRLCPQVAVSAAQGPLEVFFFCLFVSLFLPSLPHSSTFTGRSGRFCLLSVSPPSPTFPFFTGKLEARAVWQAKIVKILRASKRECKKTQSSVKIAILDRPRGPGLYVKREHTRNKQMYTVPVKVQDRSPLCQVQKGECIAASQGPGNPVNGVKAVAE